MRRPPAERVRDRLRAAAGARLAGAIPTGYQRLGRVLVVRLPRELYPYRWTIGAAWREELGVSTVLLRTGPIEGELRRPTLAPIAGGETETEVVEHGVRWRFDAARIMFAAGNRTERLRARRLVQPGETVVDLFAGIGYFTIPAALSSPTTRVVAVEKNPVAFGYLGTNLALNGVAGRVVPRHGDNRELPMEWGGSDRVFLGYLPSALPWVPVALRLLRPTGGWLHIHTLADARDALTLAGDAAARSIEAAGARVAAPSAAREVKPFGPGRTHVVVDVFAVPNVRG